MENVIMLSNNAIVANKGVSKSSGRERGIRTPRMASKEIALTPVI
jgi:hypothetical protein